MSQFTDAQTRYFTPSAAIAQYARVVEASDGTISTAGVADASIGVAEEAAYTTGLNPLRPIAVRLNTAAGTRKMLSSGTIAKGGVCYAAAAGKISATASGTVEGICFDGAASGDVCEVMWASDSASAATQVNGIAGGYLLARGESALDGSNPTPIVTGLTTVIAFVAMLKGSVAPGVSTSVLTSVISSGTANVYGWKPTSNSDPTLVASTGTDSFYWVAVGV